MKILIIGNGFDLAHYLPTAYAHFMGVMAAIEKLPDAKPDQVTYNDLFAELEKSNPFFFGRTREIYDGDYLKFDVDKVYEIKEKLKDNSWYDFFKKHMEINTWIDFEERVSFVLNEICFFNKLICDGFANDRFISNNFSMDFSLYERHRNSLKVNNQSFDLLKVFGLFECSCYGANTIFVVNEKYFNVFSDVVESFLFSKFVSDLLLDFMIFSDVFDSYLDVFVSGFSCGGKIGGVLIDEFDFVYSFNYTRTVLKFYDFKGGVEFLHGQAGNSDKKIVLGVSDLRNDLKEMKLYSFTKYHQKMMNNTDFKFLKEGNDVCKRLGDGERVKMGDDFISMTIWGHSLNDSDESYIEEMFGLEGRESGMVNIKVYFHDEYAKSSMLSNLLHIVGREKIERWMKKGWLRFDKAPDLYELNFKKKDEPSV